MFEIIIGSIIALAITYYIILGAVKDAIHSKMEPHLKLQSAVMRHQAKQNGMSDEDIDKAILTDKEFKKKYSKSK
jgi:hypothetical protein